MTAENRLGRNIRFLRESLGMSQEELAKRVDTDRPSVTNWEGGKTIPRGTNLLRLADTFEVTVDELRNSDLVHRPRTPAVVHEAAVSFGAPRVAKGLPRAVREFIQEELLEYTRAGVSEEEVEHAQNLFAAPDLLNFFKNRVKGGYDEDNVLKDVRLYAKFLRQAFRLRGYKSL